MELLLNVFWLAFALLAMGMWWRDAISPQSGQIRSRLPRFLLLSCVLILLFPVVSVTDDLHPIRPEIEESNPSKKIKSATDRSSTQPGVFGSLPAEIHCSFSFSPNSNVCGLVLTELAPVPRPPQLCRSACRAPPALVAASGARFRIS
jgi:hypothetical protein